MKHCNTCNTTKDDTMFHKRKASVDGLAARCKDCQRVYDKDRANDPKRVKKRKEYANTEEGMQAARRAKIKYAENNKQKIAETHKKYVMNNPKKRYAHKFVESMVRRGELSISPCEVCGGINVHAHHDDYDKPNVVRWLCTRHHADWHKEHGEGLNAR